MAFVFHGIVDATEPVNVKSSADESPNVTVPSKLVAPLTFNVPIVISLVPSLNELIKSVKFVFTCVASLVVPFVNE